MNSSHMNTIKTKNPQYAAYKGVNIVEQEGFEPLSHFRRTLIIKNLRISMRRGIRKITDFAAYFRRIDFYSLALSCCIKIQFK